MNLKKLQKVFFGVFWLFLLNPKKRGSFNDVDTYIVKVPNLTLHFSRCEAIQEVKLALRT